MLVAVTMKIHNLSHFSLLKKYTVDIVFFFYLKSRHSQTDLRLDLSKSKLAQN